MTNADIPETVAEQLLAPLRPNENALTPLFQAQLDESALREIAEADYGWKADECHSLLQTILKTGVAPPNDGDLREVLELIRVSEPDDPEWSPGGHGHRGHWMRLFASTVLVRLAPLHPASFDSEWDTFAQLISSAIELGQPVAQAAASVLAWRFLAAPGSPANSAFLAFGILLLAAHLDRAEDRGPWLKELAEWAVDRETEARNDAPNWRSSSPAWDQWLLGLADIIQREATWRSLARRILAHPDSPHPRDAAETLELLGGLVAGN